MKLLKTSIYIFILIISCFSIAIGLLTFFYGINNLFVVLIAGAFSSGIMVLIDLYIKYFLLKRECFIALTNSIFEYISDFEHLFLQIDLFGFFDNFNDWIQGITEKQRKLSYNTEIYNKLKDINCFFNKDSLKIYDVMRDTDFVISLQEITNETSFKITSIIEDIDSNSIVEIYEALIIEKELKSLLNKYKDEILQNWNIINNHLQKITLSLEHLCSKLRKENYFKAIKELQNNFNYNIDLNRLSKRCDSLFKRKSTQLIMTLDKKESKNQP